MNNKLLLPLISGFIIAIVLISLFFLAPSMYKSLDERFRDFIFVARGKLDDSKQIAIVTIDEKSLKALGQWPWERYKIARLLQILDQAGALIIGLDIIFAEKDRTSPDYLAKMLNITKSKLPDFDAMLAQVMNETPVVLGYVFNLQEQVDNPAKPLLDMPVSQINYSGNEFILKAKGVTTNLQMFQHMAMSAGFLNNIPDESGVIRSIPLLLKYQDKIYSSMAFEIIRLLSEAEKLNILYKDKTGVSQLQLNDKIIPTDRHGRLFLNYLGPQKSFDYISAADIYDQTFDAQNIKDKIILIGSSAIGLMDQRATPFDNSMPGVEAHATAIENMLTDHYIFRPDWEEGAVVLLIFFLAIGLSILYRYLSAFFSLILMLISIFVLFEALSWLLFKQGYILNILFPLLTIILTTIVSTLSNYFFESRQKQHIKACFSQKLSKNVVDELLKYNDPGIMHAQEKEVSIFFSDIRSFTSLSEAMGSPARLIKLLNLYMDPMVEEIMNTNGTVDKFIGDAIMAYWNAPNTVKNHSDQAVITALRQLERLEEVNQKLTNEFNQNIAIGIGINTGIATVGEMGSSGRSDYTIIGDSVNLASRLEGLTKFYGVQIVISEYTRSQLSDEYFIRELDLVQVKGKTEPVKIFEVMTEKAFSKLLPHELEQYETALSAFQKGDFQRALAGFKTLYKNNPHSLYNLYRERCEYYIANPPDNFNGVYIARTK